MATVALVSLNVSVQADAIDDLVTDSRSVLDSLDYGIRATGGLMALSVNGQVAPNGIVHGGLITENQVNAYNNALSVVAGSTFYDAELYLLDQGDIAIENMNDAVDTFVETATEISTIMEIAEMAEAAQDDGTPEQKQLVAEYTELNEASLTLSQETVTEYNESLDDIETYAQQAAAYIGLANDPNATAFFDQGAENADASFVTDASTSYDNNNNMVVVMWSTSNSGSGVYIDGTGGLGIDLFTTETDILNAGANSLFYTTSPTYLGYDCFFNETNCEN